MGIERLHEFWPEWKVESVLGAGSYGKVYKVVDNEAGLSVYSAVKVISIPSSEAEYDALRNEGMSEIDTKEYFHDIVKDFLNEIKLMITLKGAPHVVSVEGYKVLKSLDGIGWDIFIRMELLRSFKDYLDSHTPTEEEIVKIGIDIASALEICQKKNIIHRDIKPANIFIDDYGNFKLGDFGIAKELEKTTGAVSSKGTFSFMAPEVAYGQRYNSSVDIYSLGLVMYTLLNGNRPPFVPGNGRLTYNERKSANDKRLNGEPLPSPSNASPELANVILEACSYDPSKRFKSAAAFKNALQSYKNVQYHVDVPKRKPEKNEKKTIIKAQHNEAAKLPENVGELQNGSIISLSDSNADKEKTNGTKIKFEEFVTLPKNTGAIRECSNIAANSSVEQEQKDNEKVSELNVQCYELAECSENAEDSLTGLDFTANKKGFKTNTAEKIVAAILIFFIILLIVLPVIAFFRDRKNENMNETNDNTYISESSEDSKYETIIFGKYEQDNIESNGKEDIEWIVLKRLDYKMLVISKEALISKKYNDEYLSVTWETSTIREWLNSDFYNEAFDANEKSK